MERIAIIGSKLYENKIKIKDFIFKLKQNIKTPFIIVSGGTPNGADKYVKKYSIEFGLQYKEYNLPSTSYNLYSAMRPEWYNKPRKNYDYTIRNRIMISNVDKVVIFINEEEKNNIEINDILKQLQRTKKKVIIIH